MPKIPALVEAEKRLAALEKTLAPLHERRAQLLNQLNNIHKQIDTLHGPVQALIKVAREEQARTLTRWIGAKGSVTRYVVRAEGPTDKCWDSRAWLRLMCHFRDSYNRDHGQ